MLEGLAPFFTERIFTTGQAIFHEGETAHSIYFITSGEVTLWENPATGFSTASPGGPTADVLALNIGPPFMGGGQENSVAHKSRGRRLLRYVNGGIFGELDFFLRNPRSFDAVASTPNCTVQMLTRDALQSMQSQAPQLAAALEHAMLKYLCFQVGSWNLVDYHTW